MRYVVLDTEDDRQPVEVAGQRGTRLAVFNTEQRAKALVLQRLARGDCGVVAVDVTSGMVIFPPVVTQPPGPGPGVVGTHRRLPVEQLRAAVAGGTVRSTRGR